MKAAQWVKYNGSDEQIAEIRSSKHGWIARVDIVGVGDSVILDENEPIEDIQAISTYLICNPHPRADMICQQARTGQPVWVKMKSSTYWIIAMRGFDLIYQDHVVSVIKSNTPDWNIPGAEYSFEPFEEEA